MPKIIENPKATIIKNAKEILYKEGYCSLNIRKIAKRSQISVGTIYNYYPTKKDLVMEMMMEYWGTFFVELKKVIDSKDDFFMKLRKIFDELIEFVEIFKEIWLTPEFYHHDDYISPGIKKESVYMEKLIRKVGKLVTEERSQMSQMNKSDVKTYELAQFIVMNFITMTQKKSFKYDIFEKILKSAL